MTRVRTTIRHGTIQFLQYLFDTVRRTNIKNELTDELIQNTARTILERCETQIGVTLEQHNAQH